MTPTPQTLSRVAEAIGGCQQHHDQALAQDAIAEFLQCEEMRELLSAAAKFTNHWTPDNSNALEQALAPFLPEKK